MRTLLSSHSTGWYALSISRGPSTIAAKNHDLHGNAPDEAPVVLLVIDVIDDLEFDGSETLLAPVMPMAERLAALTG